MKLDNDNDKKIKKKCKKINSSIIRNISNYINNNNNLKLDNFKGYIIFFIHNIIIFLSAFIIIFNNSIIHLIILLIVISLDAFSIVVLHECPLTILEKKYLGVSSSDMRDLIFKNAKIFYNCNHTYEKQIELLICVWSALACKILIIIFLNSFNIKLINFNNLYTSFT